MMRQFKFFEPLGSTKNLKAPSLKDRNFLAIVLLVGTVTPLNNTSLKLNSVGFYQLFKLFVTPMVVLLEYFLDNKTLSKYRAFFLFGVCSFVLISSSTDAQFSYVGTICACMWVPLAAGYKVQWGRVLRQYQCSTPAMMHAVLPYALLVQSTLGVFVDPPGLLDFEWTKEAVFWIGLSGVAAFLVNLSGFLVMGGVGALAHVLLGQLKTSVICIGAFYIFGASFTFYQLISAIGAVFCIVGYTYVTTQEKEKVQDEVKADFDNNSEILAMPLLSSSQEKV